MKRFYLRFRVALMTFALGLASFWFADGTMNGLLEPQVNLPTVNSEDDVLLVYQADRLGDYRGGGGGSGGLDDYSDLDRFNLISRGCGPGGYSQVYHAENGEYLDEASWPSSRKAYERLLNSSDEIIDRVKNVKNKYGDKGEKVTLKKTDEKGEVRFSVNWFGKSNGEYRLASISAPTLELLMQFEESNIYDNY